MKRVLYYVSVVASFIIAMMLCWFIISVLRLRPDLALGSVVSLSFGAAGLSASLLKDKLNLAGTKNNKQQELFNSQFPVISPVIPIEHVKRGDCIVLDDELEYVYYSYSMCRHSLFLKDAEVLLSSKDLETRAKGLRCDMGVKSHKNNKTGF